ncbi:hypothetical protein H6G04_11165 [Calothrix membranacea FACHB-236]|nr:hypothetical protein [Calothrix membranacea FACHB-236]
MMHERNTEGLRQNAQKKRQEAFDRTEEAIKQLIKEGRAVNFKTVAEVAEVSTAWLYKEPEIKSRIEHLRQQGSRKQKLVPTQQKATEASKDAKYQALKQRLQHVEAENRGLREHLAAIHGRQRVLADANEAQQREIDRLKKLLADANAEIERIKQGVKVSQPISAQEVVCGDDRNLKSKVTPLNKGSQGEISDKVRKELSDLSINLTNTLASKIRSSDEETVLTAIAALKEQMQHQVIRNAGGWLANAIDNAWQPNQPISEIHPADLFAQWYDLAREQGIVIGSRKDDDGCYWVQDNTGQWVLFEEFSSRWTYKYLRSKK